MLRVVKKHYEAEIDLRYWKIAVENAEAVRRVANADKP
jgi:hypothetical protein